MSATPTGPEALVRRLAAEGYDAAFRDGMLAVAKVPYLRSDGRVGRGELLVPIELRGDAVLPPRSHSAWWTGGRPHESDGTPLRAINVGWTPAGRLRDPSTALTMCAKPRGREFHDHHELVATYVAMLGGPASEVDPHATARTPRRPGPVEAASGPFSYRDTASPRVGLGWSNRTVEGATLGIVGLGGTGSYVLDLVSKCAVDAIHLFDDDVFEQHSAFRAPGAATMADLYARRMKVDHFAAVYSGMHRRVLPHAVRIDARTAPLLDVLHFAFVCVDDAAARGAIMDRLETRGIPFVDVGMGLHVSERGIAGAVRTTLVEPGDGRMRSRVPTVGDQDGVYSSNVQIAELNALNAAMAVIAWKRHAGFYASDRRPGNSVFVVEGGRLHLEQAGTDRNDDRPR